ncbi:MAG: 8-oxo-dGTP diphosphatase [Candidatus Micrarchaeota archaeon]|nr:8-oxo-dGTP diphosphatase [Candidatus Micrarchaeota archaeon]MDE1834667.1 8-oxo-dGTP diphosphatase [Candidatus Micrarchaeota archaeon]MDE1858954.1 8-oxo-dGTP diphosphatase [Candidatus Micrarchaeota archaeon]
MTLGHIIKGDKILLKEATRGVSKGKWNGPGGKIDKAETPEQCMVREAYEETGLKMVKPFFHGRMFFHMDGKKNVAILGYLYSTKRFNGKVRSTEEGPVRWFSVKEIPYEGMWDDDKVWINLMLAGKRFDAHFFYNKGNAKMIKCIITLKP